MPEKNGTENIHYNYLVTRLCVKHIEVSLATNVLITVTPQNVAANDELLAFFFSVSHCTHPQQIPPASDYVGNRRNQWRFRTIKCKID